MTLRTKTLATIGVLYLVALVGVGVYAVRSSHETTGRRARAAIPAQASGCTAWTVNRTSTNGTEVSVGFYPGRADAIAEASEWSDRYPTLPPATVECSLKSRPMKGSPALAAIPPRTIYERDTIITVLIAATLGAAMAVGAALIWTKPETARAGIGPASGGGMVVPSNAAHDAESRPPETDQEASAPQVVGTSRVAESLRQLKALHDEGILTDDEYEAKRKPLTEQL